MIDQLATCSSSSRVPEGGRAATIKRSKLEPFNHPQIRETVVFVLPDLVEQTLATLSTFIMSKGATPTPTQHPDHEGSWMPTAILRFYSKFPLVVLPAETSPITENISEPTLWVSLVVIKPWVSCGPDEHSVVVSILAGKTDI